MEPRSTALPAYLELTRQGVGHRVFVYLDGQEI